MLYKIVKKQKHSNDQTYLFFYSLVLVSIGFEKGEVYSNQERSTK